MSLPSRASLPWYVAPLPEWLEDFALRFAWVIVAVNLAGTAFGFWYYRVQFVETPLVAWALVPDSPVATLFIALSLAAYKLDYDADWLHALAFFGCLKLGLWTPFVQLVVNGQGSLWWAMYWFLVVSHVGMAVQAFVIHRYATFSVGAVAVAVGWYGFNDLVDYFLQVAGGPHHTLLRAEQTRMGFDHSLAAHDLAAAAAVTLTILATFLALATRVKTLESEHGRRDS
ncbi:DUF1405 domain-containing protein [Halobacterium wangiae]|uniref:DUF1405 domain-containing protein n=1 Tax=Halobacterium wangiae TaxID=2902623 RepID=UPI001E5285AF|nr:DUF1405 domain-containing protein [Halobacterium wangiae]